MYVLLIGAVLATAVMILSFIGPESSEAPFWKLIIRIRRIMDSICYSLFNLIAFAGIGKAIYDLFCSLNGNDLFLSVLKLSGIVFLIITMLYSIRRFLQNE